MNNGNSYYPNISSGTGEIKKEIYSILNQLRNLNLEITSEKEIIDLLNKLPSWGLPTKIISKGTSLFRLRPIDGVPNKFPTNVSEISYPPNPPKYYGRANLINQTVFYGCLNTDSIKGYENVFFEVLKLADQEYTRKYYIISRWILEEDIIVAHLGSTLKHSKQLNEDREAFISTITDSYNLDMDYVKLFDQFVANEFSKPVKLNNDFEYKISAIITSTLFNNNIDGILYSSVGSNGVGINLALKKEVVDNYKIKPFHAVLGEVLVRDKEVLTDNLMSGDINQKGIIQWKEILNKTPQSIRKYYLGLSENNLLKLPFTMHLD